MIVNVYVPCDAAALSVGADDVANAILKHSKGKVNIIRNGSRGMLWLEPLVEVETPKGRVAYGPVSVEDINSLFASNFLEGGDHPLLNGITEEIPYFANQERLTFARVGKIDPLDLNDYQANGGLLGLKNALSMQSDEIVDIIKSYGLDKVTSNYIGRGTAWFDMGSSEDFFNSSQFVKTIQDEQGFLVCSPHEIAYRNGWINQNELSDYLDKIKGSEYSENLQYLVS